MPIFHRFLLVISYFLNCLTRYEMTNFEACINMHKTHAKKEKMSLWQMEKELYK